MKSLLISLALFSVLFMSCDSSEKSTTKFECYYYVADKHDLEIVYYDPIENRDVLVSFDTVDTTKSFTKIIRSNKPITLALHVRSTTPKAHKTNISISVNDKVVENYYGEIGQSTKHLFYTNK